MACVSLGCALQGQCDDGIYDIKVGRETSNGSLELKGLRVHGA